MILSLRLRMPDFRRIPITCFDSNRIYTQAQLLSIWIREIEGVAQQQVLPFKDDPLKRGNINTVQNHNIRDALHRIDHWTNFDYNDHRWFRNPDGSAIRSLGAIIINGFVGLRELDGVTYEYFLEHMHEKLRARDNRYRTSVRRGDGS